MTGQVYRIGKRFEVESGHLLTKHPERCRFPHGHSRIVEVVLEADALDANDMVVDFKALRLAVEAEIDAYDHALCINTADPLYAAVCARFGVGARIIAFDDEDPTTERMAQRLFDLLRGRLEHGGRLTHPETGATYDLPPGLRLRRLRVWETTSSWAEVEACDGTVEGRLSLPPSGEGGP